MKEKECEYGHICTSRCGNDIDCPCQSEHFCSMSDEHDFQDCMGECSIHEREKISITFGGLIINL